MSIVDFYEEETLNFNLLKGLLVNQENPKYQKYLSALIKQMKDNKDTEFISKFYDSTQFDKTFIIKLNEQWTDFFSYIAVNKILPLKQIRGFSLDSLCLLDENKIQDINVEGCKKHFDELGFPELKGIFTKRNNYTKTYEDNSFIRDILYMLKKNTWIFDYYKKSDDEGYVVVKNPIKDKRY